jgi:hypothetical protein
MRFLLCATIALCLTLAARARAQPSFEVVLDPDTFYLEEATRLLEELLEGTDNPHYRGSVTWGQREPHCYTGAPPGKRLLSHYLPEMADHVTRTAPEGADVTSWKY